MDERLPKRLRTNVLETEAARRDALDVLRQAALLGLRVERAGRLCLIVAVLHTQVTLQSGPYTHSKLSILGSDDVFACTGNRWTPGLKWTAIWKLRDEVTRRRVLPTLPGLIPDLWNIVGQYL